MIETGSYNWNDETRYRLSRISGSKVEPISVKYAIHNIVKWADFFIIAIANGALFYRLG